MLSIGIDVGGTFTDFVIFDEETNEIRVNKCPTTPGDPTQGIMQGLRLSNIDFNKIGKIVHGTTVATNAVIERKGAKTAVLITKGHKDVVEYGMVGRYAGPGYRGGQWNPYWVRPKPFVPRPLRLEVDERVSYGGEILTNLEDKDILHCIETLKKEKVEAVAVCFLNSYVNPVHERRAGELLRKHLPKEVAISLSAETVPEFREYERWATSVLNAYVAPLLKEYVRRLGDTLHSAGYKGEVFYMISSGGIVTEATAGDYPIRFILSGPAAGVVGGVFLGQATGLRNIITYDMGGTSTDVTLLADLKPTIIREKLFETVPVKTPQLDIITIGAGGGSIAWVDEEGALKVGPKSSGAVPGPVAYGAGGTEITVTDANLILGRLGADSLLKGRMKLNKDLASAAIKELSKKVNVADTYRMADGIIKICVANMSDAVRTLSVERGYDPRDFALVPMGGAGPMHSIPIAEELGLAEVLVPNNPGNACAFGLLTSDLKHDYVKPYVVRTQQDDLSRVRALLQEMADEGRQALVKEGLSPDKIDIAYAADMRYLGQMWEVTTPIDISFGIPEIEKAFNEEYRKVYGYSREDMAVELVCLRVTVSGRVLKPDLRKRNVTSVPLASAIKGERQVYFEGAFLDTPIYDRELLGPESAVMGPAIIEELGATTVLFPRWKATTDDIGNLILKRV